MDKPKKKNLNKGRVKCAVWSRVVGYLRPVDNWNDGQRAKWRDIKMFKIKECDCKDGK